MTDPIGQDRRQTGEEPTSRVFDALAKERRRVVLDSLAEAEPPVPVDDLARRVAARERRGDRAGEGEPGPGPPEGAVRRAHVSLHHTHLPKLEEAGLLDYDPDDQVVREAADPSALPGLGE